MAASKDAQHYPTYAGHPTQIEYVGIFPIGTGALPIHPLGTGSGLGTGFLPITTGSVNGSPSGVPIYYRSVGNMQLVRTGTGAYTLTFATAPNGAVKAWVEFQSSAPMGVADVVVNKRDYGTGYVNLQCYSASGTTMDPANGDAIGIQYTALSAGDPWGIR
jgi:hypothetical protein